MFKWIIVAWFLLLGLAFTELSYSNPDVYYQCRTEPMIVRVVQNGEVVYVAATSQTTWIYGSASWYMAEEDRQAHLGHVYADVVESDPKMLLTVECK